MRPEDLVVPCPVGPLIVQAPPAGAESPLRLFTRHPDIQ